MRWIDNWTTARLRCVILVATLGSTGCSLMPPGTDSPVLPEPVEPPAEIVVLPPPAPTPRKSPPRLAPLPPLPALAIVLTSSLPAYAAVATELSQRFANHEIYNLAEDSREPASILRLINDSGSGVVVAIGRRAAEAAVGMAARPVVFSQVFNYQGLLTENSRGVSAIAPLDAQVAAWKEYFPSLSRVGAIVGKGHEELMTEARLAAQNHGVELITHVAQSDQETLFVFKRMVRDIDGFWLFPDNRILSPRALHEIVAVANQRQLPVLVPTPSMLALGADVSISTVAADIAETITKVVRQIEAGNIQTIPAISSLSAIEVTTSERLQVAER